MPRSVSTSVCHAPEVPDYFSSFVAMPLKSTSSSPSRHHHPLPPPSLAWARAIASQLNLCFQSFPKQTHPITCYERYLFKHVFHV